MSPSVSDPSWLAALELLAEEIVPRDDLPGATEAGTAATVAKLLEGPAQEDVVHGLEALTRIGFVTSERRRRDDIVAALAQGNAPPGWQASDPSPARFWTRARALIVAAFFSSEAGRTLTSFPGPSVDSGGHTYAIVEPRPL